ncbi:MAG: DUF4445 domain-containing protein [Firmicutes bacterium]|nr:DUF4445 domain-containing protein [Bacillota bacterium]
MPKLSILGRAALQAEHGVNLYRLLSEEGLLDGPCGGGGRCGKCGIRFLSAVEALPEEEEFFSPEELEQGWRLACLHSLTEDQSIALPGSGKSTVLDQGLWKSVQPDAASGYGIAVDIGTTTLAACLLDLKSGQRLTSATCLNSQKAFGQDVITRIDYAATQAGGLERMQEAVREDIRQLCREICSQAGIESSQVQAMSIAANTVMTHIFGGKDPSSLAAFPFAPAFTGPLICSGEEMGFSLAPGAEVYCLPAISAYVGGDITAGLLVSGIRELPGCSLFLDIGTNGEMALCRDGELLSCSCAAGPALEGMDIRCGMRAAEGAIEDVRLSEAAAEAHWQLQVIGGGSPRGLCGSGLLALVAESVRHGIIGKNGRFQDHPLVEVEEGRKRCRVDALQGIYLTQRDVRQVQLAKGAILAGVNILLREADIQSEQVDRVLVAGQFGAHLSSRSLVGAGLLPAALQEKIEYVGNTALSGAGLCLLSRAERQKAEQLSAHVRYLELSVWPNYEQELMSAMRFSCGE